MALDAKTGRKVWHYFGAANGEGPRDHPADDAAPADAPAGAPVQTWLLPDGPCKQQVIDACTRCHGVEIFTAQPRSPDEWLEVVGIMVGNGAKLSDDEYERVVTCLSD